MPTSRFGRALELLGIARGTPIAVAVSGGADSTALVSLAAEWCRNGSSFPSSLSLALIVDHNLRKGSAEEAQHTENIATQLGVKSKLFKLESSTSWPPVNKSKLLSEARQQRYLQLYQECCLQGIPVLLTGHHADDQAENFLMRLSRGSGIDGLAGIEPLSYLSLGPGSPQVKLVRPLLQVRKQQLQNYCTQQGLAWVEDPTNQDRSYLRNLIRARLASENGSTAFSRDSETTSSEENERHLCGLIPSQRNGNAQQGPVIGGVPTQEQLADALQLKPTAQASSQTGSKPPEADTEGSGDIVRDVLLLSKVCSAAKLRMQKEADLLLAKVIQPLATQSTHSLPGPLLDTHQIPQMSFTEVSSNEEGLIQLSIQSAPLARHHLPRVRIDLRPFQGQMQSVIVRVLAQLLQSKQGLPPKLSTLHRAWKAVRRGTLFSSLGKLPKRVELQGCYLQPVPRSSGSIVDIIKK